MIGFFFWLLLLLLSNQGSRTLLLATPTSLYFLVFFKCWVTDLPYRSILRKVSCPNNYIFIKEIRHLKTIKKKKKKKIEHKTASHVNATNADTALLHSHDDLISTNFNLNVINCSKKIKYNDYQSVKFSRVKIDNLSKVRSCSIVKT